MYLYRHFQEKLCFSYSLEIILLDKTLYLFQNKKRCL